MRAVGVDLGQPIDEEGSRLIPHAFQANRLLSDAKTDYNTSPDYNTSR